MSVTKILFDGLSEGVQKSHFKYLLLACVKAFEEMGVQIDRMQIPMSKHSGLRHPKYHIILLTYKDGDVNIMLREHELPQEYTTGLNNRLLNSPYFEILEPKQHWYRQSLNTSDTLSYDLLNNLREEGFTDYLCARIILPHGLPQVFSIVTRNKDGFPPNILESLESFLLPFSICLFGAYQSSVTITLASTYLGERTGRNVLEGNIFRGTQEKIDAGIMFCDVRGFTAMSERLGAEKVVATMNQIFQCIEEQVCVQQGEILKFIGDALLIVFPREDCDHDKELGTKMIECALNAVHEVESLGREMDLPLSVGFGCHIGEVLYGNIGTETRLDFTVMGPAVNLTSRLESMCKSLGAQLTVSPLVAEGNQDKLTSFGFHKMKGIKEEVEVWGVPVNVDPES